MTWSFGLVNGKLAEVFFEKRRDKIVPYAHAYVRESEYKTKREKRWIQEDTERVKLVYRLGKYRRM